MNRNVEGNLLRIRGRRKNLDIDTCLENDTVLLRLKGFVTEDIETDLTDEIIAFVSVGKNVKLDMEGLEYISNTCQKKLVEIQSKYVEKAGTDLELCNVPEKMYARFKSLRLDTQLRIRREE